MAVYMIRCGKNGPVKIGKANNPIGRLGALQSAHWEDLFLMRVLAGGRAAEQALHRRFVALHIRGEWFRFSPEMLGDLGLEDMSLSDAVVAHVPPEVPPGLDKQAYRLALRLWRSLSAGEQEETPILALYNRYLSAVEGPAVRVPA